MQLVSLDINALLELYPGKTLFFGRLVRRIFISLESFQLLQWLLFTIASFIEFFPIPWRIIDKKLVRNGDNF